MKLRDTYSAHQYTSWSALRNKTTIRRLMLYPAQWFLEFVALTLVAIWGFGPFFPPSVVDGLVGFLLPSLLAGVIVGVVTAVWFPRFSSSAKWLFAPPLILFLLVFLIFPNDPDLLHPTATNGGLGTGLVVAPAVQCSCYSLAVYLFNLVSKCRSASSRGSDRRGS